MTSPYLKRECALVDDDGAQQQGVIYGFCYSTKMADVLLRDGRRMTDISVERLRLVGREDDESAEEQISERRFGDEHAQQSCSAATRRSSFGEARI